MAIRQIHLPSILLGAALVIAGFIAGRSDTAVAQDIGPKPQAILMGGHPYIVTSSADGQTLYIWSIGAGGRMNPAYTPKIVSTITGR